MRRFHLREATARIDRRVSWPGGEPEEILGIVPTVPLTIAGIAIAVLLAIRRRMRVGALVLAGAWLVLFTLSTRTLLESRVLRLLVFMLALYSIFLGILLGFEGRGGAFRHHSPMSSFHNSG